MKRSLITLGFLRMMLPPSTPLAPDPVTAATLKRLQEDARWRQYDFPAYRRFKSERPKTDPRLQIRQISDKELSSLLRRQAE
jgi:hypothetical protein